MSARRARPNAGAASLPTCAATGPRRPNRNEKRAERTTGAHANALLGEPQAPVAQLDRALPSEGRGHRFESCRVRQSTALARCFWMLSRPTVENVPTIDPTLCAGSNGFIGAAAGYSDTVMLFEGLGIRAPRLPSRCGESVQIAAAWAVGDGTPVQPKFGEVFPQAIKTRCSRETAKRLRPASERLASSGRVSWFVGTETMVQKGMSSSSHASDGISAGMCSTMNRARSSNSSNVMTSGRDVFLR
jgi:hypothetical protein